jgi:hypothetical protein
LLKSTIIRSALWIGFLVFCNLSQSEAKELQGKRERERANKFLMAFLLQHSFENDKDFEQKPSNVDW